LPEENELRTRWLTPEGLKLKQKLINKIRKHDWHLLIRDLPFVQELVQRLRIDRDLREADLRGTNLREADLKGAILNGANLRGANLCGANLREADLKGAYLIEANLTNCSLVEANIVAANLSNSQVYGVSAWDIKTSYQTLMNDLEINRYDQPLITVDNIEVAQFIYMLLNNKKISNIINTMRTKAVLILGSFDNSSKVILETLKDVIRHHNYLPLLFDFVPPYTQDLMETVKTMALLSCFVIIDLSTRSGQLHELASLVRDTYIPFATIACKGTKVTGMLGEFKHHYWYRSEIFPYSAKGWKKQIPQLFENEIIPWVEKTNDRLREERS